MTTKKRRSSPAGKSTEGKTAKAGGSVAKASRQGAKPRAGGDSADSGASSAPADLVDAQLAKYRSMRDFGVTAEPSGGEKTARVASWAPKGGLPFCIQKHAASHLHYDFRLGWNGVLKSWACAKGPSYFTGDKRLAVQVEDHPMEYGGFEGIIPAGQYGGGTVMLWDQGTWEPQAGHEDVDEELRKGSLKFVLHGTKMHGRWTLVRMGGKAAGERKPNWLLIKEHDEFERGKDDACVTVEEPNSVVTGRSIEEIAHSEDHVWNSKETAGTGQAWYRRSNAGNGAGDEAASERKNTGKKPTAKAGLKGLKELPEEKQPEFIAPELAVEGERAPEGPGWLHELKLDGYRMQARKDGAKAQMLTRSGLDWTARMRAIAAEVGRLPAKKLTLDGEVVVLGEDGTTNFADLQAAFQEGAKNPLTYFCFDLLHAEGRNTRGLPLLARKELLKEILAGAEPTLVQLSEHLISNGEAMFHKACELGAEGIISKRAEAPYREGRGRDWLKLKCLHEQEFVVGGYTLPGKGAEGTRAVGALLLGYYRGKKLIYAGRTGTGFTQKSSRMLRDSLEELERDSLGFDEIPREAKRGARWVKPEMVVQVRFATWTADNLVRQAAFLGVREDKTAADVRREEGGPKPKGSSGRGNGEVRRLESAEKGTSAGKAIAAGRSAAVTKSGKVAAKRTSAVDAPKAQSEHAAVRLTHPAKILDEASGMTKQMLADYYWEVSEWMLPEISDRPLSLVRCPEGSGKPCFFQKHVNAMLPPGIESVDVPNKKTGVPEAYITLNTRDALAGLAQMGVLEVHPWGSHNETLETPDRLIFDLDPDESLPWGTVADAAQEVRKGLKAMRLESWLKTTGGKGLHVVIPIEPELEWTVAKEFAHGFVLKMEKANPGLYLTKMTKSARAGKIYLDYLRNERGATAVAAYSPRARAGGPVSMPLEWAELKAGERPVYRVAEFAGWRGRLKKNPWKKISEARQRITGEMMAAVGVKR